MSLRIAYQGTAGAYSEECAAMLFPDAELAGHRTFAAAFDDLQQARADAAVLPVENSTAGAVSDVYDLLLGHADLTVVGEAIIPVRHCLLGLPGATLAGIRAARSHPQALAQSEAFLRARGIEPRESYDTAGATDEDCQKAEETMRRIAQTAMGVTAGLTGPPRDWRRRR